MRKQSGGAFLIRIHKETRIKAQKRQRKIEVGIELISIFFLKSFRTFVKMSAVCYHVLRNSKEDMTMRTVFKILLVPVWLLLAVLKLAFKLASGAASFVLAIGGGLLLVYDLFLLNIGIGSKELMLQLLTVGGLLIAIPLLAGIMTDMLEAAQESIKEFIGS